MSNLTQKILEAGINNCLFLVPMRPLQSAFGLFSYTSSNDPEVVVTTKIDEERYKLSENYKITLKSTMKGFGKEHYYIRDLELLINEGVIEFFVRCKIK